MCWEPFWRHLVDQAVRAGVPSSMGAPEGEVRPLPPGVPELTVRVGILSESGVDCGNLPVDDPWDDEDPLGG